MANQKMPEDIKGWCQYLSQETLPATPAIGKQVLLLLKTASPSYGKLAEMISIDPVLSYLVMAHAHKLAKHAHLPDGQTSNSVEHAISMIGVEDLRHVVSKVSYFKPDPTNIRHFYYLRSLNTSLFAAFLAREIAKSKTSLNASAVFWGALYHAVPQWFLWRFATPEMRLVRYAIRYNEKFQAQAEKEILGCTTQDITLALAKQLPLPQLAAESLRPENQLNPEALVAIAKLARADMPPDDPEDRRLNHLMHTPNFVVSLCNQLAQAANFDWYSDHTLALQKALATLMGFPTPKAITFTHRVAVSMSRQYAYAGVMTPATKLFLPPRDYIEVNSFDESTLEGLLSKSEKASEVKIQVARQAPASSTQSTHSSNQTTTDSPPATVTSRQNTEVEAETPAVMTLQASTVEASLPTSKDYNRVKPGPTEDASAEAAESAKEKEAATPTGTTPPSPGATKRKRNLPMFNMMLSKLNDAPEEFSDLHEMMNAAAQGIGYGLGLKRCTVALVNNTQTRLKAYYSVGTMEAKSLAHYQLDLTKPSLFTRLLETPAGIWVKPTSNRRTWAMIPDEFKRISGAKEFFLMSIFLAKKPVAVFYCDSGDDELPFSDWEYQQFKTMCGGVTRCLVTHTQLKKKAAMEAATETPESSDEG